MPKLILLIWIYLVLILVYFWQIVIWIYPCALVWEISKAIKTALCLDIVKHKALDLHHKFEREGLQDIDHCSGCPPFILQFSWIDSLGPSALAQVLVNSLNFRPLLRPQFLPDLSSDCWVPQSTSPSVIPGLYSCPTHFGGSITIPSIRSFQEPALKPWAPTTTPLGP